MSTGIVDIIVLELPTENRYSMCISMSMNQRV